MLAKNFHGLQAQMKAFAALKQEKGEGELIGSTQTAAWLIMLLFIVIETVPTFFRMMMEDGPYDDMLRAEQNRVKKLAELNISEIDDEVKTDLQISTIKNSERLRAEFDANKEVIAAVAAAQSELVQQAIDLWKAEELNKINQDPGAYISATSPTPNN